MTAGDKHNVLRVKRPLFFHAGKKKKKKKLPTPYKITERPRTARFIPHNDARSRHFSQNQRHSLPEYLYLETAAKCLSCLPTSASKMLTSVYVHSFLFTLTPYREPL